MIDDPRQPRRAGLRAGWVAAAAALALLAALCSGSPAGAAPAPHDAVAAGGYLYWSNTTGRITKPGNGVIVRARLNGTGVDQKFITGASFPDAITAGPGYLYWANQNSDAIGRARLNGTEVNQHFIASKDFTNLHGIAAGPCR